MQPQQPPLRFEDRDAFLAWADQHPGRWERVSAVVHARPPERLDHNRIKLNILSALTQAIRVAGVPCEAFVSGPIVMSGPTHDFVPDIVVNHGERASGAELSVDHPVIVVEVLSPSRDTAVRLDGYFALPVVQHYLLVSPDGRLVMHHERSDGGRILTRVHREEAEISLEPPGLRVRVAKFYAGTDLARQKT